MKKFILPTVFSAALLSVIPVNMNCFNMPANVLAVDDDSENADTEYDYYEIDFNDMIFVPREDRTNELMLRTYYGNERELIVPETVEGLTVTGINDGAFANSKAKGCIFENVTLPDSIDYFGSEIFENSTVVSVNIPKKLRFIPSLTFSACKALKTVVFHDDIISIANSAFQRTSVTIPENLQKRISDDSTIKSSNSKSKFYSANDDFAFLVETDSATNELYCNIIKYTGNDSDLIIPESIFNVPVRSVSFASLDKSEIKSITFPETERNISVVYNSFKDSSISEAVINSPCTLEKESFKNCTELKTVKFNKDAVVDINAFSGCTSLTSVEFCGKAKLSNYSFNNCQSIENVIIDTSQAINGSAFDGCTSLMNINSEPVFDSITGDFNPKYSDFIKNSFYMAEEVGFLNEYVKAQYKQIADDITSPEMTVTQKIKAFHDWVCNNTKYAEGDTNALEYHTDASVLLNDSTVCEGYAKAFNLLCHSAGIESYYVFSSNHAWNIVKIGGHYFHVDTTWDDGSDISYSWFLKSDSEMSANNSHGTWKTNIPTSLHSFQKDGTPECSYQIGDVNKDGKISIADLLKMNRCFLNAETETADDAVLYDLTFDGSADVFDMILMRKKVIDQ